MTKMSFGGWLTQPIRPSPEPENTQEDEPNDNAGHDDVAANSLHQGTKNHSGYECASDFLGESPKSSHRLLRGHKPTSGVQRRLPPRDGLPFGSPDIAEVCTGHLTGWGTGGGDDRQSATTPCAGSALRLTVGIGS
jgi:hypothetical protein